MTRGLQASVQLTAILLAMLLCPALTLGQQKDQGDQPAAKKEQPKQMEGQQGMGGMGMT